MNQIPRNVSEFDKDFVEDSITGNTLEIQSLQIALDSATDEEWRGQIQMMIAMHTSDLQQALAVAKKIGADTTPDLTHASVYPETPDYDLGKRFENLEEEYLIPLRNAAGSVTGTVTPTGIPTDTPFGTATEVPTETGTVVATDTATAIGVPTDTPTAISTEETATGAPTDTPTAISTEETATGTPFETPTGLPTETGTVFPTDTPTAVGTPPAGNTFSMFDTVSLDIIEDEHVADVQAELAAERLVRNNELQAFAKHSADVTELHLLLMGDLKHRAVDNYTPPPPEFQADYQNPRKFQP
jgi:hypothetical protein